MYVIKKDNTKEEFNKLKIKSAIEKSAKRVMVDLAENGISDKIADLVEDYLINNANFSGEVTIEVIHNLVEKYLDLNSPKVSKSYKDYRNYKKDFIHMMDEVYKASQHIRYIGDKENSNTDSSLVATKRSLIYNELNKRLYRRFFMTQEELQACKDGYIYVHDQNARLDTLNCCLCDIQSILKNGFEMGNIWYNEPKSLDTAFDVIGDIILSCASQQYGGFTIPEIDKVLAPYAKKSFNLYKEDWLKIREEDTLSEQGYEYIYNKVKRDFEQGFQGIEYKLNTVGSSRGDYPFITMTLGLGTSLFEKMASITFLEVHRKGQGKEGHKKPVLFPKIVFLYDEELHGEGKPLHDVFEAGIDCSCKTMYPDWLSLSGDGYVASIYKKYKKVISPMGCRAFLSPWYVKGGIKPFDENDEPVFVGRFNIGAVSLHLPMILAKSRRENKDFFQVLDYYLDLIRKIHCRTYEYLGELKASVNPVMFCEGGFYGGHLKYNEKIKPLLKSATASFGYTALNELQELYNKKSIREDGQFALDVLKYINHKIQKFKEEDGNLYAIYGTPAESLCGLQIEQFRKEFGIIEKVSDKPYVTNSFHCHVSEDMSPIEKQDKELKFWDLSNGGKIQYVRYPLSYNREAVKSLVLRAMKYGFYEGVNLSLAYCEECGYEELEMNQCPKCGSNNITKIDRMNGYLSYSRIKGDTRLNSAKMSEIKDRKSM